MLCAFSRRALLPVHLRKKSVPLKLVEHQRAQLQQPEIGAGGDKRLMEPAVALNPLAVASHPFRPGKILDNAQAVKGSNNPRLPFVVSRRNGLRQGAFLECYIMLGDFRKIAP